MVLICQTWMKFCKQFIYFIFTHTHIYYVDFLGKCLFFIWVYLDRIYSSAPQTQDSWLRHCFYMIHFKVFNPTKLSSHTSTISHIFFNIHFSGLRYKYFNINYEYLCKIVDVNDCETIFFLDIKCSCLYYLFIYFNLFLLT